MARKTLIRSSEHPYHVTGRANNKEEFPCDKRALWRLFNAQLSDAEQLYGAKIHAFVLMPNHFHLLISTPKDDLGIVMQHLMRSVTKITNAKTGRSGRIFGAKYHWSLVNSISYFDIVSKYVYRNPVKASLALTVEDYAFSTLKNIVFDDKFPYSISPPRGANFLIPENNLKEYLAWLNTPFKSEYESEIKAGLKKANFLPPKKGWRNRSTDLSNAFYNA